MQKTFLAWAAGIFDGEGSLAIKRTKRAGIVHYQIWVTVGMSDRIENENALNLLKDCFGGNMCRIKPIGNRIGAISWTIVSRQAMECLTKILPYLVIKKRQAELLIEFQNTCISRTGPKKNLEKLKKQEEYFYKVSSLNFKGKLRLQRLSERTPNIGEAIVRTS